MKLRHPPQVNSTVGLRACCAVVDADIAYDDPSSSAGRQVAVSEDAGAPGTSRRCELKDKKQRQLTFWFLVFAFGE
eukprot:2627848-Rhodomonas_salina.2